MAWGPTPHPAPPPRCAARAVQVIPCIETAHDVGIPDLDAHPQPGAVRVFKTHCWRRDTPRGAGKYIYVVRGE